MYIQLDLIDYKLLSRIRLGASNKSDLHIILDIFDLVRRVIVCIILEQFFKLEEFLTSNQLILLSPNEKLKVFDSEKRPH